jgi:hypothetical protein
MRPVYCVLIAPDVIVTLRIRRSSEEQVIMRLFDQLANDPFRYRHWPVSENAAQK